MSDLTNVFQQNLVQFQYQPGLIQQAMFDYLEGLRNGEIDIADASGPFPFNLSVCAMTLSAFLQKDQTRTRLQYPSLAQTADDLWPHMSNWDYAGMFAQPSHAVFGFAFSLEEILNKLVTDPATGIRKIVIPRTSRITVAGHNFTLLYPIEIRQMLHGGLQIVYDASEVTPLQTLQTNVIPWEKRVLNGLESIYFEIPLYQVTITPQVRPINGINTFTLKQSLTNQYYFTRVWNRAVGTSWTEIMTTMTPEVYNVTQPTAVIKVTNNVAQVMIPNVYPKTGALSGDIRCDFYDTEGDISVDLGAYSSAEFQANWEPIDASYKSIFSAPMATLQVALIMGAAEGGITLGGGPPLSFADLRDRVINNATGSIQIPITNAQIEGQLSRAGYSIVKNVDNITNRTFLATKPMPTPTNPKLITPAAASIETITTSMAQLANVPTVVDNGTSMTITPKTIFKNVRGVVQIAPQSEIDALMKLIPAQRALAVNANDYYYTPFHYVLDTTGVEFAFRPYYLDAPVALTTVFLDENDTTLLQVSTGSYKLIRTSTGYQLQIKTQSSSDYQNLPDDQVAVQLAFIPDGERDYAYLNGVLAGHDPTDNERVFTFDLSTTYNIDANDRIEFTQFKMYTTDNRIVKADLTTQFDLFYTTNKVMDVQYVKHAFENNLGRFLLPADSVGITNEQIRLKFGDALRNLWARARSVIGSLPFKTYPTDVPLYYTEDVYETDANGSSITVNPDGSITYNILHHKGDPVLDANGNQVYAHRAGDVMTDPLTGQPIVGGDRDLERQLEIMMIEGAYYFATDSIAKSYRDELVKTVLSWVTEELAPMMDVLLEQTELFFYPKSTMGWITVQNQNGLKVAIKAGQSLQLMLYVPETVAANTDVLNQLTTSSVNIVNQQLQNATVAKSQILEQLRGVYQDDVIDVEMRGLGNGDTSTLNSDMSVFTVLDDSARCSLKKILVAQGDDSLIVSEALTVIPVRYNTNPT